MSYFALAVARDADGWSAAEVTLADAADLEDVSDRLREVNPAADLSLLFVESDDSYLAILRLDDGEDLRVFGSDVAFAEESRLGALLLGEVTTAAADLVGSDADGVPGTVPGRAGVTGVETVETTDESADEVGVADEAEAEEAVLADVDATGDVDILADLGVGATRLLKLCGHEGLLPSDITTTVCQVLGCADEVEELRGR